MRGPIKLADGSQVGAPGQPMGTCDYCGTGIAVCCTIKSADGKRFIVGSDCVAKTGDKGLKALVRKEGAKRSKAREAVRILELRFRLTDDFALRALLAGKRHPQGWAHDQGQTFLDQAEWMMHNAGHAGRIRLVRTIAKLEK